MKILLRFHSAFPGACSIALLLTGLPASAANYLAIGDSLTAEYETIPNVPGFSSEATAYAEITVKGWESKSWVEVLARILPRDVSFGGRKRWPDLWSLPRLTGYEFNWGIPGIEAGQYEDFVTSSIGSNFAYSTLRQPLESQLRNKAQRVVVWLGTNEFRANYGAIYDGANPTTLIDGLVDDLGRILDFVRKQNSKLQVIVVNIPDLGATPTKKAAHPDATKRARVTAAITEANRRIEQLAYRKGAGLADAFAESAKLVADEPIYFGAVRIVNDLDEDNDPHFAFTRDGLHPNTALQILNARAIALAFTYQFGARLPYLSDAQALKLLGISPNEPFYDWLASFGITDKAFITDDDLDTLPRFAEFALGLSPVAADVSPFTYTTSPERPGELRVDYTPDPAVARSVRFQPQYSADRVAWKNLPAARVVKAAGVVSATFLGNEGPHHRLRVSTNPPNGSNTSVSVTAPLR